MRRREFIVLAGATAAAWPLRVGAQAALPVIGFVSSSNASPNSANSLLSAFRQGLNESGYIEGQNVIIEYRWAGGRADKLPELVADLLHNRVALIVASGGFASAMAAKAATETIPILFVAGFDPVKMGLVTQINRPNGNATGVSVFTIELLQKRLQWLLELVPAAKTIALLVNPNPFGSGIEIEALDEATRKYGLRLLVLNAHVDSDLEAAFTAAAEQKAGALAVSADPFFTPRRARIVALAAQHRLPTIYPWREYVTDGGLMSYGPTLTWAYRQLGLYAGRILHGAKPADLPVQLPRDFELVINQKTADALGLTVSRFLLAATPEFIE